MKNSECSAFTSRFEKGFGFYLLLDSPLIKPKNHQNSISQKHPLEVNGIKDVRVPVSVLLPHEVAHALATCNANAVFGSIMYGGLTQSDVNKFWDHIKTLEPWAKHPCLCSGNLSKTIAVQLHADGAEMFRDDEYFCFSWSSLFSTAASLISDVMLTRFPFMIVAERHMQQAEVSFLRMNKCFISIEGFRFSVAHGTSLSSN